MKKKLLFPVILILVFLNFYCPLMAEEAEPDEFTQRRLNLMGKMEEGLAIISSRTVSRGQSSDNKFFFYLTGVTDRSAYLVLQAGASPRTEIYNSNGDWTYDSPKKGDIKCFPVSELQRRLLMVSLKTTSIFLSFRDFDVLTRAGGGRNPFSSVKKMVNTDPILQEMRTIKSGSEIQNLARAINITADALIEVFKAVQPGMKEVDLAAILEYHYKRSGSSGPTFLQAASGPNSTFVHFDASDRILKDGDMIVFDVGAAYQGYTSDITRSIPANGRFSPAQKDIYSLVLDAQKAGIRKMITGNIFGDAQKASEDILMKGLHTLGLVTDPESPWQKRLYIQHGFYHFIGLDVHDVWSYYARGVRKKAFREGMVITWEPGLYFPEKMLDKMPRRLGKRIKPEEFERFAQEVGPIYNKYANIGVRIEDDILITDDGNRILSSKVPKEIKAIEKLMKKKSPHNKF